MKKIITVLASGVLLVFLNTGCQQQKPMDDAMLMTKVDSSFLAQQQSITDQVMKDCDANKPQWIQMKADSIFKADSAAAAMNKK